MPRNKNRPASARSTDLLSYLPADRRAALESEIVGDALASAIAGATSVGEAIDTLTRHALWEHIGALPPSALEGAQRGPSETRTKAKPGPRAKRSAALSPHERGDLEWTLIEHLRENPGSRLEEIFRHVGGDRVALKAILKSLRSSHQVTTTGARRGMRYTLAESASDGEPGSNSGAAINAKIVNDAIDGHAGADITTSGNGNNRTST